jgi:hypothetical protein
MRTKAERFPDPGTPEFAAVSVWRKHFILQRRHDERVRKRAESRIRALVWQAYKNHLGEAMRRTRGMSFRHVGHRRRYAEKLVGIRREEVAGAVLHGSAALALIHVSHLHFWQEADSPRERNILVIARDVGVPAEDVVNAVTWARTLKDSRQLVSLRQKCELLMEKRRAMLRKRKRPNRKHKQVKNGIERLRKMRARRLKR